MMLVKYPYHVRHDGRDYAPGEPIEVEDAAGHLLRGAVIVEDENPKQPPRRRRAVKPEE